MDFVPWYCVSAQGNYYEYIFELLIYKYRRSIKNLGLKISSSKVLENPNSENAFDSFLNITFLVISKNLYKIKSKSKKPIKNKRLTKNFLKSWNVKIWLYLNYRNAKSNKNEYESNNLRYNRILFKFILVYQRHEMTLRNSLRNLPINAKAGVGFNLKQFSGQIKLIKLE